MNVLRKLLKKKWTLITAAVAVAVVFGASASAYLNSQALDYGRNPLAETNENVSQMLVTGEKYTLSYEDEQEYLQAEQQREEVRQEKKEQIKAETGIIEAPQPEPPKEPETPPEEETPDDENEPADEDEEKPSDENGDNPSDDSDGDGPSDNPGSGSGTGDGGDGDGSGGGGSGEGTTPGGGSGTGGGDGQGTGEGGDNTGGEVDVSKLPTIICSLTDGEEISGKMISFTVKGISYRNEVISSFYYTVTLNGNKLYSSGTQNGNTSYRTTDNVNNGNNVVTVTVRDEEGNTATKTYTVIMNTEEEGEIGGTIHVSVSAETLGLGTILSQTVTFYEGENLAYVIDRAFSQAGISYSSTGALDYGFYLNRVYKTGITNGYHIPDSLMTKIEELGMWNGGYNPDSLGEFDFARYSGWIYLYNGAMTGGFSTVPAEDGDVVQMKFTLHMGNEFDGSWSW